MFRIDPRDALPIWKQIEDGLRRLVGAGSLRPGSPVPSVRDLARELQVNPMTVSKAYQRLTEAGLLEVRRGDGTYVSASPPTLDRAARTGELREAAQRYAAVASTLGGSLEDATRELALAWRALKGGGR
jgi:GntR family transcriptional regulator